MRQRLKACLQGAIKAHDRTAVVAFRSAAGAVDNAAAVQRPDVSRPARGTVAKATLGVGAADFDRRKLSAEDMAEVIRAEVAERIEAATEYRRLGRPEHAAELQAEAAVLQKFLDDE